MKYVEPKRFTEIYGLFGRLHYNIESNLMEGYLPDLKGSINKNYDGKYAEVLHE